MHHRLPRKCLQRKESEALPVAYVLGVAAVEVDWAGHVVALVDDSVLEADPVIVFAESGRLVHDASAAFRRDVSDIQEMKKGQGIRLTIWRMQEKQKKKAKA